MFDGIHNQVVQRGTGGGHGNVILVRDRSEAAKATLMDKISVSLVFGNNNKTMLTWNPLIRPEARSLVRLSRTAFCDVFAA